MIKITPPFKDMQPSDITQGFSTKHKALDIVKMKAKYWGYGEPLVAPEDCEVKWIVGDEPITKDTNGLTRGYGIHLKGLETGSYYTFWHCLPYFPVTKGERISRGKIVAYMGNAGEVYAGGKYVDIADRTDKPYLGTHVHFIMFSNYKKDSQINPLPHIDFSLQSSYNSFDVMKCASVVISKMLKAVGKK